MNRFLKNRKGFTLIELIVVIVIIAILVAALTPAVLGVIESANQAADQADARSVLMAAGVAALQNPTVDINDLGPASGTPPVSLIGIQFSGASNLASGTYTVFFEGRVPVGCQLAGGGRSNMAKNGTVPGAAAPATDGIIIGITTGVTAADRTTYIHP